MVTPRKIKLQEPGLDSLSYFRFVKSIRSPYTRRAYENDMKRFLKAVRIATPDDLLLLNTAQLNDLLIKWVVSRQEVEHIRPQSVGKELSSLRKFFLMNSRKDVAWEEIRAYLKEGVRSVKDRPYEHAEIAKMLGHADVRIKAAILLMCSAGIRVGGLTGLLMRNLQAVELENSGALVYRITVYEHTKDEYTTYCTPECKKVIDEYHEFRQRCGEVFTPKTPVLREFFGGQMISRVLTPRSASHGSIAMFIRRSAVRAGIREVGNNKYERKAVMLNHGMRKFFKSNARKSKVDMLVLEYLMGHRSGNMKEGISKLMMTYDPSEEGELLTEYVKAIDNLTINEENRLRIKVVSLEAEKTRWDKIEARLAAIEKEAKEEK